MAQNTMARMAMIPERGITGATPDRMTSLAKESSAPMASNDDNVGKRNQVVEGTAIRMTVRTRAAPLMAATQGHASR